MPLSAPGVISLQARRESALLSLSQGGLVLVIDDQDGGGYRADLVMAAATVDGPRVAEMIELSSGLICAAMTDSRAARLDLPEMPMSPKVGDPSRRFSVAVDAAVGVTTGISARDRAHTLRVLAAAESVPGDLTRPGHVMVLRADPRGHGPAAAALRLCESAGLSEVAVVAPLMFETNDERANREQVLALSDGHAIPVIESADTRWNNGASSEETRWSLTLFGVDSDLVCVRAFGRLAPESAPLIGLRGRCLDCEMGGDSACRCARDIAEWTRTIERHGAGAILVYRDAHLRCVDRMVAETPGVRTCEAESFVRMLGIRGHRML